MDRSESVGYSCPLSMDGIILIDKPAGITSAEVVRRVKSRLGKRARVGHLGTLDPFATGVLPILVGEATKLATFLTNSRKEYEGLIRLGAETDTLDRTGEVVRRAPVPAALDGDRLETVARQFTGHIRQVPPVYSAIKRDGVRLYRLARRGDEVEAPPPRDVDIFELELTAIGADAIRFRVECSSGMYARALARDVAAALGTAGHLEELRRIRNGDFRIQDARPLDDVLDALASEGDAGIIRLVDAMPAMPQVAADASIEKRLRNGDSRALDYLVPPNAEFFKVVTDGRLVAIAETTSRVTASISRVFN